MHELGDEYTAQVHYHHYRITGGEACRQSAADICEKLYEKVPEDDFREKLEILGNG